jgi:hypothetical protein
MVAVEVVPVNTLAPSSPLRREACRSLGDSPHVFCDHRCTLRVPADQRYATKRIDFPRLCVASNLTLGIYYQPVSRASREHRYLGVYKNKRVQGVGEIDNVVVADLSDDGLRVHDRSDREKPVSQEQRERIEKAIHNARDRHGYDIATGYKFFLLDKFHETDFQKVSSGGLMAQRYFDLANILKTSRLPDIEEIARLLREKTW